MEPRTKFETIESYISIVQYIKGFLHRCSQINLFAIYCTFILFVYRERFGLYELDTSTLEGSPRKSAYFYKHIIKTNALDVSYEPEEFLEGAISKNNADEDNEIL